MRTTFELTGQRAKLISFNPRAELHGDESQPAGDLKISFRAASDCLAMFGSQLRDSLFWTDPGTTALTQAELDGLEVDRKNLRNPQMVPPFKLDHEIVGGLVTIDYGIKDKIDLAGSVNKFAVTPLEGGSVEITFRVQAEIESDDAGRLCMLIGREITVDVEGPQAEPELGDED